MDPGSPDPVASGPSCPDLSFPDLVEARFVERLSRFHVRVALAGASARAAREALAHLPNSGRLRELLVPGNRLLLAPRAGPGRTTGFDVTLALVPEDERGPDPNGAPAGRDVWACVDARLPPRILARALDRDALPSLRGWRVAGFEPSLDGGRVDLLLRPEGRAASEVGRRPRLGRRPRAPASSRPSR